MSIYEQNQLLKNQNTTPFTSLDASQKRLTLLGLEYYQSADLIQIRINELKARLRVLTDQEEKKILEERIALLRLELYDVRIHGYNILNYYFPGKKTVRAHQSKSLKGRYIC